MLYRTFMKGCSGQCFTHLPCEFRTAELMLTLRICHKRNCEKAVHTDLFH